MDERRRLQATLGSPELTWLIGRLTTRLERGQALTGVVTKTSPSELERRAVERLLGRPPGSGRTLSIHLGELEALVRRAGLATDLTSAVHMLVGPVPDRRAARVAAELDWDALFAACGTRLTGHASAWTQEMRASGLLRRLSGGDIGIARDLCEMIWTLNGRLPANGIPLAELAAAVTNDSHALDSGEPLGTLAVRLAAHLGGMQLPGDADDRRAAWASVGVMCDELSAPLLVLNLRIVPGGHTAEALRVHADAGEPYRLSVRQLLRGNVRVSRAATGPMVYACENCTVVAAIADRLGARSPPIICTDGYPKAATRLLLTALRAAEIEVRYHGDFDWDGITIANLLISRHAVRPWRMQVEDYARGPARGSQLVGASISATWDDRLRPAMLERGRSLHEEAVLSVLLDDLARL